MAFVNVCRQSVVAGFWPNGGLGAVRNSRHRMIPARYTGSGGLMCDDMKRDDLTLVRLKRRVEFIRIARSGRGHVTPGLVLQVARQDKANADPSEQTLGIGFTASKKVGNAVARNRVKRRLRAAVQEVMPLRAAANQDYVVIGRAATADRPFGDLKADLITALDRTKSLVNRCCGAIG